MAGKKTELEEEAISEILNRLGIKKSFPTGESQ
jgi:hypothetical protein